MPGRPSTTALNPTDQPLLAQIPDLDAMVPLAKERSSGGSDGRILSQSLSGKLVLGGGIAIVLLALAPFALLRKTQPKAGDGLASGTSSASAPVLPGSSGTLAQANGLAATSDPAMTGANAANPPGPAYLQPQPQASSNRPMALNDATDVRPTERGAAANYQADLRAGPAADYRAARADYRDYYNELRDEYPGAKAPQGNPLMPSPTAAASQETPPSEPGVARFEGTIERPPLRTNP
jgi:hypothetical protein